MEGFWSQEGPLRVLLGFKSSFSLALLTLKGTGVMQKGAPLLRQLDHRVLGCKLLIIPIKRVDGLLESSYK